MTLGFNDGDGAQAQDPQQLTDRWQYSVVTGCVVSPGTNDMTVQCEAGEAIIAGGSIDIAAQDNVSLDAAHPDYPRKDTVYLDATGTLTVATGTAEPPLPETQTHEQTRRPAPPSVADATILAEVWVPADAADIAAGDVRDRRVEAELAADGLTFDVFRDQGRFEMIHLNTFNVGGDAKQAEVNLTIADYTDKDINKILLFCEHLSVYTASGGNQTFAVQINGQSGAGAYENMRVDGSTTANDHAIIAKAAANTEPMMGHVWFHADQDFMVYPEGSPRGAGIDGTIHRAAVDNAQSSTPWTIDSLRFYTPDGDEIRMRRATVLGFSEGAN